MHLPVLHRNAIHGLLARDQQASQAYQQGQSSRQLEWVEVFASIEGATGLPPGALGTTHTLNVETMEVVPLAAAPDDGTTPAEEA